VGFVKIRDDPGITDEKPGIEPPGVPWRRDGARKVDKAGKVQGISTRVMADQQTRFLEGFADGCSQQSAGTGITGPAAHPDLELLYCSGVALMGYHPARIVGFRAPTWEDILARHENMGLMALPHQYAGNWSIKPDDN